MDQGKLSAPQAVSFAALAEIAVFGYFQYPYGFAQYCPRSCRVRLLPAVFPHFRRKRLARSYTLHHAVVMDRKP
jgi:hypothetical protein